MKKMSWGKVSLAVLCVSLLLNSCSKGSDGAAGATGPAGPAGPAGPTGATGSANVIYSAWLDVSFTLLSDSSAFVATITAPKLVDSILQKGEIKVYIRSGSPTSLSVFPLPYFDGSDLLNVAFQVGKINMVSITGDFSTFTSSNVKLNQYRYILIPGGIPSGRSATIDWNNYAEVKKYLNLKD